MGYYKNELIAGQVELGDRVPAPKPARHHVAWDTRRDVREAREWASKRAKYRRRLFAGWWWSGALTAFPAGVIVGVIVGVFA